jgi:hypothetical protein
LPRPDNPFKPNPLRGSAIQDAATAWLNLGGRHGTEQLVVETLIVCTRLLVALLVYSVVGVLYRIGADQIYVAIVWKYLQFDYQGLRPPNSASDLLNTSVSIGALPFDLSVEQMRLVTILAVLPVALLLAYLANFTLRPRTILFLPVALAGFFTGFYATSAGALPPSTGNSIWFVAISAAALFFLFRRQTST